MRCAIGEHLRRIREPKPAGLAWPGERVGLLHSARGLWWCEAHGAKVVESLAMASALLLVIAAGVPRAGRREEEEIERGKWMSRVSSAEGGETLGPRGLVAIDRLDGFLSWRALLYSGGE